MQAVIKASNKYISLYLFYKVDKLRKREILRCENQVGENQHRQILSEVQITMHIIHFKVWLVAWLLGICSKVVTHLNFYAMGFILAPSFCF